MCLLCRTYWWKEKHSVSTHPLLLQTWDWSIINETIRYRRRFHHTAGWSLCEKLAVFNGARNRRWKLHKKLEPNHVIHQSRSVTFQGSRPNQIQCLQHKEVVYIYILSFQNNFNLSRNLTSPFFPLVRGHFKRAYISRVGGDQRSVPGHEAWLVNDLCKLSM